LQNTTQRDPYTCRKKLNGVPKAQASDGIIVPPRWASDREYFFKTPKTPKLCGKEKQCFAKSI
jgi:hypothetical protein